MSVTKENLLSVLHAIGELSSQGIMVFNTTDDRLEYVNAALASMFDITHGTFYSQPAFFVNHIVDDDIEYLKGQRQKLMSEKRVEDVEFHVVQHDGSLKLISLSGYLLEDGQYVVGVFNDITHKREHENYIVNYGAKKDTLLEMVTHNLSAPLTLSKGMVDSLEQMVKEKHVDDINVQVQLIKENTRHCIEIVTDFLEEEHMVSEQVFTRKNRFDLVGKIGTVLERFRKAFPEFDFILLRNRETVYVNNDDVKFLQMINNLLSNAIKWSPVGSVVEIRVSRGENTASVVIRDHGIGIPEGMQPVLFEKYTPAARPGLRGEVSSGMGLYIVKKLAHLMGGSIRFQSRENEGTTFVFEVPLP